MIQLTIKERMILDAIKAQKGKQIDINALGKAYYNRWYAKKPKHWEMSMYTTLRNLKRKGAPIRKVSGFGRGNKSEWEKMKKAH